MTPPTERDNGGSSGSGAIRSLQALTKRGTIRNEAMRLIDREGLRAEAVAEEYATTFEKAGRPDEGRFWRYVAKNIAFKWKWWEMQERREREQRPDV